MKNKDLEWSCDIHKRCVIPIREAPDKQTKCITLPQALSVWTKSSVNPQLSIQRLCGCTAEPRVQARYTSHSHTPTIRKNPGRKINKIHPLARKTERSHRWAPLHVSPSSFSTLQMRSAQDFGFPSLGVRRVRGCTQQSQPCVEIVAVGAPKTCRKAKE